MSYALGGLGGSCSAAVHSVGGLIVKLSLHTFKRVTGDNSNFGTSSIRH